MDTSGKALPNAPLNTPSFALPPDPPTLGQLSGQLSGQLEQERANAFFRDVIPVTPGSALPPAYESLTDVPPPAYTPFARGVVQCSATASASHVDCLARLTEAYDLDFAELAARLQFPNTFGIRDGVRKMTLDLIREDLRTENAQLRALAVRLEKLYIATEQSTAGRTDKNRLAFIATMFMLEQKALLAAAATNSTGLKPPSASLIRKEFFVRLRADCPLKIRNDIDAFLVDHGNLRDELEGLVAVSGHLRLSDLCFDDIPGAVVSAEYQRRLDMLSQQYGVDFARFVEAMGDCRSHGHPVIKDPVQKAMTSLGIRGCKRIPLLPDDSYLDLNAKLVITAMSFFQGKVFGASVPPDLAVMGEKCPTEPFSGQEASAVDEKIAAVRHQFVQFLLSICAQTARHDIYSNVDAHVQEQWPKGPLPRGS